MKAKNSLLLFLFSIVLVSCFDSPEFSNTPTIKFEDIYFGKARGDFKPDSLVIAISFEDGDGDLGLDQSFTEEPFHPVNFYVVNGGNFIPVATKSVYSDLPPFLSVPPGASGKLAVLNTSRDPLYTSKMPSYNSDQACIYYSGDRIRTNFAVIIDSVLIDEKDRGIIDESYDYYEMTHPTLPSVFVVKDTFYIERNPNYQNIEVEFYRKTNNEFVLVDWYKILCTEVFEARFPVLTEKQNPLSGVIKYSMKSTELEQMLGNSIWKLRVRIRDRALNVSDHIDSKEFTLQEIMR
jgi:hypothetical protein